MVRFTSSLSWSLLVMLYLVLDARAGDDHRVVGLHIGIGEYTDPSVSRLTLHRTTDEHLLPLLRERYDVQWLPSALDVDRDGFRDALLGLLHEASRMKADGAEVTTLLVYTGHGSRVKDQDGDELDGLDETFVTVHGSLTDGRYDVRDDDIHAFRKALESEGIHLTLIVEACHSESSSRGPPTLNVARTGFSEGPAERLFLAPEFDEFYDHGGAESDTNAQAMPVSPVSFVSFTAADDRQLARTLVLDQVQWGVLSLSMYRAILEAHGSHTYADLFASIRKRARDIDRTLKGTPQTPYLHYEGKDAHRLFLGREPIPFAIRLRDAEGCIGVLSAGTEAGLADNAIVGLFGSIDEMSAGSEPITTARVTSSGIGRSIVEGENLRTGMYCRIITPGLDACPVHIDSRIPPSVHSAISRRLTSGSIAIVERFDDALFSLEPSPDGNAIEIRWVREPLARQNAERIPPIARFEASSETGRFNPTAMADELERLIRIQRLIGVAHRSDLIGVQWTRSRDDLEGSYFDDIETERPTLVLNDGDHYFIKIRNNSATELYFHLIEVFETDTGVLGAQVIPQNRSGIWQGYVRLPRGGSHIVSNQVSITPGADRESVTHLWFATPNPMENLTALIVPRGVRAAHRQNPVLDMLNTAAGTRSAVRADVGIWSARSYQFEIGSVHSREKTKSP